MNRRDDPRNDAAWWTLLVVWALTVGASLLGSRVVGEAPALPPWLAALSWTAAWLAMARFRWLAVRWWKTWIALLALAWLLTLLTGRGGAVMGAVLAFFFAWDSRASLRLMSGGRRAVTFFLGLGAIAASMGLEWGLPAGRSGDLMMLARTGLQVFWLGAVLSLLFGMRLHFLRLRPKLFVTGVLVGVVPFVLLLVFSALLLYATLGGSRANRARDVLTVWSDTFAAGEVPAAFDGPPRVWDEQRPEDGLAWGFELVAAARAQRRGEIRRQEMMGETEDGEGFIIGEKREGQVRFTTEDEEPWLPSVVAAADTTVWLTRGAEVWLVRLRDPAPGEARVEALELTPAAMQQLARFLRVDVEMQRASQRDEEAEEAEEAEEGEEAVAGAAADTSGTAELPPLVGRYLPDEDNAAMDWWERNRYFGAALIPTPELRGRDLDEDHRLVTVKTSLADLAREFVSTENYFNMGIIVLLGVLAFLLGLTGLVALLFSLRITGGITRAVQSLHEGTRRLARGDLDAHIEIPNEDEFGDLADSFNEMAVAVKQGREDALARERLMQEMDTAREIQERLLPHEQPLLPGWEITGVSIPSLQVGGDYFDFIAPSAERLGIAVGDVSGKGVPAALLMSNLQACLKGQALHPAPVSDIVTRINDLLSESTDAHMFATFLYGELDGLSGRFECVNAGHDPALVVRRGGEVEWISSGGLLLGMFGDQHYDQVAVDLAPGDVLVLYTDGITEAGAPLVLPGQEPPTRRDDEDDDLFGEERLAEVVVRARERSALGVREAILEAVRDHLAGEPQGDDITLVVVKRGEEPSAG